jgi:hypothetical protein
MGRAFDTLIIAVAYLALATRASEEFFAWAFLAISLLAFLETALRFKNSRDPDHRLARANEELNAAIQLYAKREIKRAQNEPTP